MASALEARITPARRVAGQVRVPGDKSISHRYALIGALAAGTTRITNYSPGADCSSTLECLRRLGVKVHVQPGPADRPSARTVTIDGRGLRRIPSARRRVLDAGNSGTTTRLFAGALAAHPFSTTITGDESLRRRPMKRVIEPLSRMGARFESANGCLPLTIIGSSLSPIEFTPCGAERPGQERRPPGRPADAAAAPSCMR